MKYSAILKCEAIIMLRKLGVLSPFGSSLVSNSQSISMSDTIKGLEFEPIALSNPDTLEPEVRKLHLDSVMCQAERSRLSHLDIKRKASASLL